MIDKFAMYHNKIDKVFNNNKLVYSSYLDNNKYNVDVRNKIDSIINSDSFIYSKLVNIMIGSEIIKKRIVGIRNNSLITIDNEEIPIDGIKDIYI